MKISAHMNHLAANKGLQKKLAGVTFAFFLIKGLLWLTVPAAAALFFI